MIQAIKWMLFQYNLQDKLMLLSYTWKAALLLGDSTVYRCDLGGDSTRMGVVRLRLSRWDNRRSPVVLLLPSHHRLPVSSSTAFGVNSHAGNKIRGTKTTPMKVARDLLAGKELLLWDEAYVNSLPHLYACRGSYDVLFPDAARANDGEPFGSMGVVFFGDPFQHSPPGAGADPLYWGAANPAERAKRSLVRASKANAAAAIAQAAGPARSVAAAVADSGSIQGATAAAANAVYEQCTEEVFRLTEQKRTAADAGGALLHKYSRLFMRSDVTREEVAEFVEAVNDKAISSLSDLVAGNPHVAILRHKIRQDLNHHLVKVCRGCNHAAALLNSNDGQQCCAAGVDNARYRHLGSSLGASGSLGAAPDPVASDRRDDRDQASRSRVGRRQEEGDGLTNSSLGRDVDSYVSQEAHERDEVAEPRVLLRGLRVCLPRFRGQGEWN